MQGLAFCWQLSDIIWFVLMSIKLVVVLIPQDDGPEDPITPNGDASVTIDIDTEGSYIVLTFNEVEDDKPVSVGLTSVTACTHPGEEYILIQQYPTFSVSLYSAITTFSKT